MAGFNEAFSKTMLHEGWYSNDPADPGGETFKGISRRYHPDWPGWDYVDRRDFSHELENLVREFYLKTFWEPLNLSECPLQPLANELFDTSVNCGTRMAVVFLQRAINALNQYGKKTEDVVVDGVLGPKTMNALSDLARLPGMITSTVAAAMTACMAGRTMTPFWAAAARIISRVAQVRTV